MGRILLTIFIFTAEMKYTLIHLPERVFGIFPPGASESSAAAEFEPIFLNPSQNADFEIRLCDEKSVNAFYIAEALLALSVYFFEIRALPLSEIEISHSVSNFTLEKSGKVKIKIPKCKYKFTKTELEICGVHLEGWRSENILAFPADSLSHFDISALNSALLKQLPDVCFALAYSEDEAEVSFKKCGNASFIEAALALLELLLSEGIFKIGETVTFASDGGKIKLKKLRDSFFEFSLEK